MHTTRQNSGSTIVAVIAVVVLLAVVVFAGLRLNQARTKLIGEVDGLQSELSTAHTRAEELQSQVNAERAAREQAEAAANEAGNATALARQELQNEQEKLVGKIQGLETSIQDFEQRMAAALEAKEKAETELSRETGMRKAVEQEIADVKNQLQQKEALAGQQPPPGTSAEVGTSATARTEKESQESATSAAKQRFDEEAPADASLAFDTPPEPLDLVSPEYPRSLRRQGTEGTVVVAFTVDTRGRAQNVEVQEATNSEFEKAAVAAVRKWRFKPALRDGEPVEVRISQALTFTKNN